MHGGGPALAFRAIVSSLARLATPQNDIPKNRACRHRIVLGDDYSIADIATFPWVRNLVGFYGAGDLVGFADFPHVARALAAFAARPAVVKGLDIPKRG